MNQYEPPKTIMKYIVEPIVHKDEDGYKPGFRHGWEGQPLTTEVLVLTFDEERFAWPHARAFAEEKRKMVARSVNYQIAEMRKRLGL